ncbi:MAG: hypothetical protein H7Y00_13455 [Fimbriimonadaceae bacterium]|nr:hypothetical protein [Chitinophagales bacterium]
MNNKVIITDHLHPFLAEKLPALGFQVDIVPDITNEELFKVIHEYVGLVLSTKILVTQQLIDKAAKLKFIARAGSGMENIDVQYAQSKNIHVVNSPDGNANAVAEHALGMLLSLLNNIVKADRDIRNGIWQREENRGEELDGKIIGIIGYGHTGSALAKKLSGFDVRILVYDKYKTGFSNKQVEETTLDKIQQFADIISFHVPHTTETHYYLNSNFINSCKKKFRLMNTSRGEIVNTGNFIGALQSGKILGAALDVFENEKFYTLHGDDKKNMETLILMDNVILTPHIAGWTKESYFNISKILFNKIQILKI